MFGKRRGKMHIPRIRDKIKRKVPAAARDDNNGKRMAMPLKTDWKRLKKTLNWS
jgi:hypothetical protein